MEKLGKMTFKYKFEKGAPVVKVSLPASSDLNEVFLQFEGFLRAAGYSFGGHIDIVNDDFEYRDECYAKEEQSGITDEGDVVSE